jgi:hypothetical protein
LGRCIRGDGETRTVEIASLEGKPLRGLEVISCPDWVDVKSRLSEGDPAAARISVALADTAGPGVLRGEIRVRGLTEGGPLASRSIPVAAVVYDDIIALPSAILIGAMAQGSHKAAVVTLQSQRQEPFTVERIACDLGCLKADVARRPTPSSAQVRIAVEAEDPGALDGVCSFLVRTEGGRDQEVAVRVRGIVIESGTADSTLGVARAPGSVDGSRPGATQNPSRGGGQ